MRARPGGSGTAARRRSTRPAACTPTAAHMHCLPPWRRGAITPLLLCPFAIAQPTFHRWNFSLFPWGIWSLSFFISRLGGGASVRSRDQTIFFWSSLPVSIAAVGALLFFLSAQVHAAKAAWQRRCLFRGAAKRPTQKITKKNGKRHPPTVQWTRAFFLTKGDKGHSDGRRQRTRGRHTKDSAQRPLVHLVVCWHPRRVA